MRIAAPLNTEAQPEIQWIEVASSMQLPGFQIIGLPAPEVGEARERIRAAIEASDFEFPRRRVILNLSPASIKKRGTGMDLAMALAVLVEGQGAPGRDETAPLPDAAAWGELSLQGEIRSAGSLTRTLYAIWKSGIPRLVLARDDLPAARAAVARLRLARPAEWPPNPPALLAASNLKEAWALMTEETAPASNGDIASSIGIAATGERSAGDLIPLAPALERTIGLAAAGEHHLLLLGPRGTGKSHALEWLIELQTEAGAGARVQQALLAELSSSDPGAGFARDGDRIIRRVGPQVKCASLIGSASSDTILPGEFSLADGGLLVADEFPEWARDCREALREPLERGVVTLTRLRARVELPASFRLAANGNLCPCGGWPPQFPHTQAMKEERAAVPRCRCSPGIRSAYLSRLSGPILDRLEIIAIVASPPGRRKSEVTEKPAAALSRMRARIEATRSECRARYGEIPGRIKSGELDRQLKAHPEWSDALETIAPGSLRARHKVLKVAMTIAAWDRTVALGAAQLTESAFYRPERLGLCD